MEQNLDQQVKQILENAEKSGVSSNFFFMTTFNRYITQINSLNTIGKRIKDTGIIVTDSGQEKANPLIKDYNSISESANSTCSTLLKIIKQFDVVDDTQKTKASKMKWNIRI